MLFELKKLPEIINLTRFLKSFWITKNFYLHRASDNDLLLCRKSTSNKTCHRQWFDWCIISKMILKSGSNWLFPVVFSVQITLSGSHSGNSFEFSHRLTGFLDYGLFCVSFCLRLNLKAVNYLKTRRSSMAVRSPW
jgi:hypothetical protein